jgi:hypothetical protein
MSLSKRISAKALSIFGYEYKYGKIVRHYERAPRTHYFGKEIISLEKGNTLLSEKLSSAKPFFAARLGSAEVAVLYNYLLHDSEKIIWDKNLCNDVHLVAGVFPNSPAMMKRFCEIYFESIPLVDVMGVWYNEGEEEVCQKYCPKADLMPLESLEPYYFAAPWSKFLAGKKVLVVHPFEKSILHQYHRCREKLFENKDILPEFELKTIKAVQSYAQMETPFKDWEAALEHMKNEIAKQDYDICLIGAGAYGLPLGAFVKQNGKTALHLGGASQILFGIIGQRWFDVPAIAALFNEHWKRPEPEETPRKKEIVDKSSYW